jgi:2-polyprenyl-3-methyl-5-hydroxy-6-metoxy-1,4-benzoquinol methylase
MAEHLCPWWLGYVLACPIRRLVQSPEGILGPHLSEGMTAVDVGCAMGYFTLPMARLVGPAGRVVAIDLQECMLRTLQRRLDRAGLAGRVETRCGTGSDLAVSDLEARVDFALAFAVVHEVEDPEALLAQAADALRPGGRLLLVEPAGHVSGEDFEATRSAATAVGLEEVDRPAIRWSHAVLMEREARPRRGGPGAG